jgi:hypothetical protein
METLKDVRLFDLSRKDFETLPKNSSHDETRSGDCGSHVLRKWGGVERKGSLFAWIDDKPPGLCSGKVNEDCAH